MESNHDPVSVNALTETTRMKSTLATLFTGAALALSLTGCALSPQQIEVKPTAEVQPANRGKNQQVQVIAVDYRKSKV